MLLPQNIQIITSIIQISPQFLAKQWRIIFFKRLLSPFKLLIMDAINFHNKFLNYKSFIMSKEKKVSKIDIKQSKLGLLYLTVLEAQDRSKFVFACTIQGFAYLFKVNSDGFEEYDHFQPQHPICATYFDKINKQLFLGDIVGGVTKYNLVMKKYQSRGYVNESYKYQDRKNQPILHLFKQDNFIMTVNFCNQIKKIDFNQLQLKDVVEFQTRILKATSFKQDNQYFLVLSLQISRPPFVFANPMDMNFKDAQKFLADFYKSQDEQSYATEVLYNETTKNLITVNRKSEICLYSILNQIEQNARICEKLWSFKVGQYIILDISCHKEYLCITSSQQIEIIDISKKMEVQSAKKLEKIRWGFILQTMEYSSPKKLPCKLLISKGFNPFNQSQSKVGKPTLHWVYRS